MSSDSRDGGAAAPGRFAAALEAMEGDAELLAETAVVALRVFGKSRELLTGLQGSLDFDAIAAEAHKLVSGWHLFAPEGAGPLARALEKSARDRDGLRVADLLATLVEEMAQVEADLREWSGGAPRHEGRR